MHFSNLVPTVLIGFALHVALIRAAPADKRDSSFTCENACEALGPLDPNNPDEHIDAIDPNDPNRENICIVTADINPTQPNGNNFNVWDHQCNRLSQKSIASGDDPSLWIGGLPSFDVHLDSQTFDYGAKLIGVSYVNYVSNSGITPIIKAVCNGGTSYLFYFNCRVYE